MSGLRDLAMSKLLTYYNTTLGMVLPSISRKVTQSSINVYAEATGDFHPLHVDQDFARKTPFNSTIAHNMTPVALISTLLNKHFGKAWNFGSRLKVFFREPCCPGDTIMTESSIANKCKIDGRHALEISIRCENQNKETIIEGKAVIFY